MKKRRHDSPSSSPSSSSSSKSPTSSSFSSPPSPDNRKKPSSYRRRRRKREPSSLLPKRRSKRKKKKKHLYSNKKRKSSQSSKKRRGRVISISPPTSPSCSRSRSRRPSSSSSRRNSNSSSSSRSPSRSRRRLDDDRGLSRGRRFERRRGRERLWLQSPSSCSSSSDGGGGRRPWRVKRSAKSKIRDEEDRVEIIQHYGDDPESSRSIDSCSDGSGKRDEADGDDGLRGDDDRFSHGNAEIGRDGSYYDGNNPVPRLKSVVVVPAEPAEEDNDLEVLLRQKALDNLRKFRHGNPRDDANSSSLDANSDIVWDDGLEKNKPGGDIERRNQMALDLERAGSEAKTASFTEVRRSTFLPQGKGCSVDSVPRMAVSVSRPRKKQDRALPRINFDEAARSSPIHGNTHMLLSRQQVGQEEHAKGNSLTRTSVWGSLNHQNVLGEKNAGQAATGPSTIVDQDPGHKDGGNKGTNEDSELESKTMTVMRGGEMVQVKYKVYIPKKAPSLARRQLKR